MVRQVRAVPDAFDARFSALWRRYTYRIADEAAERDPLRRHDTVWLPGILDVAAMDEAAGAMLGLHDFAAFCKARPEATTIRTLQVFRWQRELDGVLVATVQADAFCHSMVRALVGALAALGRGRPVDPVALLRDPSGPRGYTVLAPHGLVLVAVGYPDDAGLAARAAQTRARRDREPGMCEPGGGVS